MIWVEKYYFALNRQEECWEISYLQFLFMLRCFECAIFGPSLLPVLILNVSIFCLKEMLFVDINFIYVQ